MSFLRIFVTRGQSNLVVVLVLELKGPQCTKNEFGFDQESDENTRSKVECLYCVEVIGTSD